jgi:hypothetical protein
VDAGFDQILNKCVRHLAKPFSDTDESGTRFDCPFRINRRTRLRALPCADHFDPQESSDFPTLGKFGRDGFTSQEAILGAFPMSFRRRRIGCPPLLHPAYLCLKYVRVLAHCVAFPQASPIS